MENEVYQFIGTYKITIECKVTIKYTFLFVHMCINLGHRKVLKINFYVHQLLSTAVHKSVNLCRLS